MTPGTEGLDVLASDVDAEASLALFERRSARDRRQRRFAQGAVAAVGVAFLVLAASGLGSGDGSNGSAGAADGTITFEVLDVDLEDQGEPGDLGVVVDQAGWESTLAGRDGPRVDFGRWIVLIVTTDHGACERHLARFERDGTVLRPVFGAWPSDPAAPPRACPLGLGPRAYAVAVERADLPRRFTLRPPDDMPTASEEPLVAELAPLDQPDVAGGDEIGFEVLEVRRSPLRRVGDLRAIDDASTFAADWAALGLGQRQTVPDVEFWRRAVIVLTTATGGCPSELVALTVSHRVLTPRLAPTGPDSDCGVEVVAHTFVVTVSSGDLAAIETLRLAGDPVLGIPSSALPLG